MNQKIIFPLLVLTIIFSFGIPQAFAYDTLQDSTLTATSATIFLQIDIGQDTYKPLLSKIITTNHLSDIIFKFYGDEIDLSDSKIKIYSSGDSFLIKNIEKGILMFGHKTPNTESFKINIYLTTNEGFQKFVVHTNFELDNEKKIIEIESTPIKEETTKYIPKLIISSSHDFSTYWKDTFNIDVLAYDENINSKATGFEGRLDDVDITVIITKNDKTITTLKGITEYGEWLGEHYIKENLVQAGEYIVNVIATLNDQSVSKTSSMFVIGTVSSSGGSSNHTPVAVANADNTTPTHLATVTLDASSSSDSDVDTLTFLWVQTSGNDVRLSSNTVVQPTFDTLGVSETYVFQLTVTDPKGKSSIDTITINVNS